MTWPPTCVRRNEPLANHTSFRIGGPAEWFAEPQHPQELMDALRGAARLQLPVSVLGGGTNTLAADRGVRGLVVKLGLGFRRVEELARPGAPEAQVLCGAALLTQRVVTLAAVRGWGGVETLAGLPGQVGGAVAMNAQGIGRFVREVRLVGFDGTLHRLPRERLEFRYRYTPLPTGIITDVLLEFPRVSADEAAARIDAVLKRRNLTQELRLPSAGCAFRNPPEAGSPAGRLLDAAGLKGARIGDARISERHANFIVNVGAATCADVLALMEHAQRSVRMSFGVELLPEIRILGESWRLPQPAAEAEALR
ncbi:MAG TPA: UDP-N-acetylmuramate dehydrogenase [bacterium]